MLSVLMFWGTYLGGIAVALFRAPYFAFLTYMAVYFYNPEERWWGDMIPTFAYSYWVVILMACLVLVGYRDSKYNKIFDVPQLKWVYLFLAAHYLSGFFAVLPLRHEIYTTFFLKLVVIITIAYKLVHSSQQLYLLILGYIYSAWYLSFYIFQVGRNSGSRVEGVGTVDSPDANGIAAAIAPSVVFGIYSLWRHEQWWARLASLFVLAFLVNALVLINSRGAILGIIVGASYFLYALYFGKAQRRNQKRLVISIVLTGMLGATQVIDQTFIERMYTLVDESQEVNIESESGSTRITYWKAAVDAAIDNPLGSGAYAFNYYAPEYIPADTFIGQKLRREGGTKSVHSSWISALVETGFLGLAVLILMFLSVWRSTILVKRTLASRAMPEDYYLITAIQAAILTFAVAMTFLDRHRAEILYWLVLFSAVAHNVYIIRKSSAEALFKTNPNSQVVVKSTSFEDSERGIPRTKP